MGFASHPGAAVLPMWTMAASPGSAGRRRSNFALGSAGPPRVVGRQLDGLVEVHRHVGYSEV